MKDDHGEFGNKVGRLLALLLKHQARERRNKQDDRIIIDSKEYKRTGGGGGPLGLPSLPGLPQIRLPFTPDRRVHSSDGEIIKYSQNLMNWSNIVFDEVTPEVGRSI